MSRINRSTENSKGYTYSNSSLVFGALSCLLSATELQNSVLSPRSRDSSLTQIDQITMANWSFPITSKIKPVTKIFWRLGTNITFRLYVIHNEITQSHTNLLSFLPSLISDTPIAPTWKSRTYILKPWQQHGMEMLNCDIGISTPFHFQWGFFGRESWLTPLRLSMWLKADQIKGAGNPKRKIKGAQNSLNEVKGTLNSPNKGSIRDHYDPPRDSLRGRRPSYVWMLMPSWCPPVRGRRPSYG